MPINLVYRGGSGAAVSVPSGTVIWDGEKYVTYAGEELVIGGCDCDTTELEEQVNTLVESTAEIDNDLTAVENRTASLETRVGTLEKTDTSGLESRIVALEEEDVSLDARITAIENIGIAEEGAY